jgi:NAD(P)-dependent dehydrogenase (short-subunit alcohol dehydrogenase family)
MTARADEIYDELVSGLGSLAGRVYAITGTTTGTGYWAAVAAVRSGAACVMLLNRPSSRAELALEEIKRLALQTSSTSTATCSRLKASGLLQWWLRT